MLAVPLPVGGSTAVVLELFDKPGGFAQADKAIVAAAAEIGADLIRQAVAERQTHRLLFDAVAAALDATTPDPDAPPDDGGVAGPPAAVLERLKMGLGTDANATVDADTTLRLVAAVRELAVRHGPPAVEHCVAAVTDLRRLLDRVAGMG